MQPNWTYCSKLSRIIIEENEPCKYPLKIRFYNKNWKKWAFRRRLNNNENEKKFVKTLIISIWLKMKKFEMVKISTVANAVWDPTYNASVQRIWDDDFEYEELLLTYTLSEA